jgi:hypothetical protein
MPWPAQQSKSQRIASDAHAAFSQPSDSRSSGKGAEIPQPEIDVYLMGHAP